jgi:crotonobetainyl-CoA:carnitine CoA-transferase CaiB-like acyl-CoA transferase
MAGALDGLKVLDLSNGIAGPMATMILGDNGAAVTTITPPRGDPFAGHSGYVVWQRGKRNATLDLASEAGRHAFFALAATADVVVESFGPGSAVKLGVDHVSLAAVNPRLICCTISGYGTGNAHSDRPGYDALVAARTGLFFDQRGRVGTPMEFIAGRPGPEPEFGVPDWMRRGTDRVGPVFPRSTWPSLGASLLATLGITAALRARELSGRGQHVEVSLLQGALAAVALNWQRVEHPDAPLYWMWPLDARAIEGLFECSDGRWVHHWTVRPSWVRTVSEGDQLALPDVDHNYRDDPDRLGMEASDLLVGHFLHPELADAFRKFSADDWQDIAARSEMGVAKVRTPAEALADPSFLADGCVVEVLHPTLGAIRHVGNVIELGATPGRVTTSVHLPGADTDAVLAEALATRVEATPGSVDAAGASTGAPPSSPLAGLRIIDLGLGVAGPFAPRMLADLGADVIKVHALHDTYWSGTHMGLGTNRGKRSISLNLKDPRGLAVLHRLIDGADVIATNWRPGAMARLGLDEASLRATHPGIIVCNSRGYEKGPKSDLPGTDQTANALCGTEWEDGACDAGNPPLWSRSGMGDTGNALLSAIAITMALYDRERTGLGQSVSTSIVNACLLNTSYAWIHTDGSPGQWDHVDREQWGLHPLYRMYATTEGWIAIAVATDHHWADLRRAIDRDDLARDASLGETLTAWFADRSSTDAFALLDAHGVPIEIVDEKFCRTVFDDPQMIAAGLIAHTSAPGVGRFEDPGLLINFSETPGVIQRGPCRCGQHTNEILVELGYTDPEIADLKAANVVLDAPA